MMISTAMDTGFGTIEPAGFKRDPYLSEARGK